MGGVFNPTNGGLYAYAGNNPVRYTDPDGEFAETAWDVFSLVTGVASFVANVREGNVKGAIIDGLGVVADAAAVALPFIPGGASTAINATRLVSAGSNIAGGLLTVEDGLENNNYVEASIGLIQTVGGVGQLGSTLNTIEKGTDKFKDTLKTIKETGKAPDGYVGGRTWANDGRNSGRVLPKFDKKGNPITYKEWDVNPYIKGQNRGAERLVTGSDGSAWKTSDHYMSFAKIE